MSGAEIFFGAIVLVVALVVSEFWMPHEKEMSLVIKVLCAIGFVILGAFSIA